MKYRMIFALLGMSAFASADIYRWVDSNGKVHYGDRAPQSRSDKADKVTVNSAPAAPDPQAEEARRQLRQMDVGQQRARAYESQKVAEQQQQSERLATNCKALQDDIRIDRETAVFYGRDEAGNRVLWTSEQRLAYREKLHNLNRQYCADAAE
jgi:hypothetical protein